MKYNPSDYSSRQKEVDSCDTKGEGKTSYRINLYLKTQLLRKESGVLKHSEERPEVQTTTLQATVSLTKDISVTQ